MTNDAKLGMVAGVVGVIVAAVLFSNAPKPEESATPQAANVPEMPPPHASTQANAPQAASATSVTPSTPVVRTRKDVDAQPASRSKEDE